MEMSLFALYAESEHTNSPLEEQCAPFSSCTLVPNSCMTSGDRLLFSSLTGPLDLEQVPLLLSCLVLRRFLRMCFLSMCSRN